MSTGSDQAHDLAIDGVESCSYATHVPGGRLRLKSGEDLIDNGHDDGRTKHIASERLEHCVV